MPAQFAYPAALGDLLAALLAFAALVAVVRNHRAGRLLVWVFNGASERYGRCGMTSC
jgi:hypothetical protein